MERRHVLRFERGEKPLGDGYSLTAPSIEAILTLATPTAGKRTRSVMQQTDVSDAIAAAGLELAATVTLEYRRIQDSRNTSGLRSDGRPLHVQALRTPFTSTGRDKAGKQRSQGVIGLVSEEGEDGAELIHLVAGELIDDQFVLPLPPVVATPKNGQTRSYGAGALRRSVAVLRHFTDDITGEMALNAVTDWEETKGNRPYKLWQVRPEGGGTYYDIENYSADWAQYDGQPTLLLIHGTFSNMLNTYNGLLQHDAFKKLYDHYGGRVLAFDHPTLQHSPEENIARFLDMMPNGIRPQYDLVMHSRGGLVGRELLHALGEAGGHRGAVQKAVFVASTNGGTPLTDPDHWIAFTERFATLLNLVGDQLAVIIEGVLTVAKLAQSGALKEIPGLYAMNPKGHYIDQLAAKGQYNATYYALTSNFSAPPANPLKWLVTKGADATVDKVFGDAPNDLVVPVASCFDLGKDANGKSRNGKHNGFPIPPANRHDLKAGFAFHHTNYFGDKAGQFKEGQEAAVEQIMTWLLA